MRTVILHVGYHKTGTTAIQALLTANSMLLREHGVLFPEACAVPNTPEYCSSLAMAHHRLPLAILEEDQAALDALACELATSSCDAAVISSEVFMERFKNEERCLKSLADLLSEYHVRIIVYLRPQFALYESVFNQQVKDSMVPPPLNPSRLTPYYNYLHWLRLWARYFGHENITVRPYELAQLRHNSLLRDFMYYAAPSIPFESLEEPPPGTNPRMHRDALMFKQVIGSLDVPSRIKSCTDGALLAYSAQRRSEGAEGSLLSASERYDIWRRYVGENAEIAREFLGRSDGRLFLEDPPEPTSVDDSSVPSHVLEAEASLRVARYVCASLRPELTDEGVNEVLGEALARAVVQMIESEDPAFSQDGEYAALLRERVQRQSNALIALRRRYSSLVEEVVHLRRALANTGRTAARHGIDGE